MSTQLPICKNDRCPKIVPPSRNPGRPRLFCSPQCGRRYHSRTYYAREAGSTGGGLIAVTETGVAKVNRRMPPTAKLARQRYLAHLRYCALHNSPCPARDDPFGRKKLCLVAAVFSEDWMALEASEQGRPIPQRSATTRDGGWIADLTEAEKQAEKEIQTVASPIVQNEEERQRFFDAGGGQRDAGGYSDPKLAEYNRGLPVAPES